MSETFKRKDISTMALYTRQGFAAYTDVNGNEQIARPNQMRLDYQDGLYHGIKFGDGDRLRIPLVHNDVWPVEGPGTIVVTGNAPSGMEYIRCGGFTVVGTGALKTEVFSLSTVAFDTSPQTILDTWPRSNNRTFWEDPTQATGDAAQWFYDPSINSFVQPVNAASTLQMYSLDKLTNYTFDCILTSSANDDDGIGLVAAADIINGNLTFITVWVHAGGFDGNNHRFSIRLGDETNGIAGHGSGLGQIIKSNNIIPRRTQGWSGARIRVRIIRNGDTLSVQCSDWNSNVLNPASLLTVNTSELPRNGPQLLNNPARVGFATNSQQNSTYLNYRIVSPDIGTYLDQYVEVFEDATILPEGQTGHLMTFKYYNEDINFSQYEEYAAMEELNTFLHAPWS